jgi:hypothetical protein
MSKTLEFNLSTEWQTDETAGQMEQFRACWKARGNDARTDMKDA